MSDARGVRGWWARLAPPWHLYFPILGVAFVVWIALIVMLGTDLLPRWVGIIATALWAAAPAGAFYTAALDRRRQMDAVIREDLVE